MAFTPELEILIKRLKKDLKDYFGARLNRVYLYGSYARGDYNDDSNVDIMVLLNDKPVWEDEKYVSRLTFEYMYNHNVLFTIMLQLKNNFEEAVDFYAYYQNILNEGRLI